MRTWFSKLLSGDRHFDIRAKDKQEAIAQVRLTETRGRVEIIPKQRKK